MVADFLQQDVGARVDEQIDTRLRCRRTRGRNPCRVRLSVQHHCAVDAWRVLAVESDRAGVDHRARGGCCVVWCSGAIPALDVGRHRDAHAIDDDTNGCCHGVARKSLSIGESKRPRNTCAGGGDCTCARLFYQTRAHRVPGIRQHQDLLGTVGVQLTESRGAVV